MPESSNPPGPLTPVPTEDLHQLTVAVTRIDGNVKSIKRDLLPPLSRDTREARDAAREALGKVNTHTEDASCHGHTCSETERQRRQDRELQGLAPLIPRVGGLSKLLWAVIGILITGVTSAMSFALVSRSESSANTARIENQAAADRRHEELIQRMERLREADRQEFIRFSRELPRRIVEASPAESQVRQAVESLPLTTYEQRRVRDILEQARSRRGAEDDRGR